MFMHLEQLEAIFYLNKINNDEAYFTTLHKYATYMLQ